MSSLQPRPGHFLLRCPHCGSELAAKAGSLACRRGHSFDIAREGYVNLLRGYRRCPAEGGDTATQLQHRATFLDAGCLDIASTEIVEHLSQVGGTGSALQPLRLIDAGCGTGHYLARIASQLPTPCIGLGLDISKDAARYASKRLQTFAFAVADVWSEWPVRDAAADLVISIFAPKNFREVARVLRPGGWYAIVYPGPDHLIELRDRFHLLRQREQDVSYKDAMSSFIGAPFAAQISQHILLDPTTIRSAILMGPNARHLAPSTVRAILEPLMVTIDIQFLFSCRER